ncbi:MAG: hypothetical protein VB934_18770 [Polyangiaceae bacterium]
MKPEGSSDTGGLTGAATSTGATSAKTRAPGGAALVVTLANGTTIRVPNGLRKKDTSARSLPTEIAQMKVFTWPGGDRLISISEMVKDEKKSCAQLLDDQWERMKKSQAEEKDKPSGMTFEDTTVAKRRVLFFSGLQQGIYGAKEGRPKVVTSTLTACESGSLVLFAHANKKATIAEEGRRLLFSLVSTMRSRRK